MKRVIDRMSEATFVRKLVQDPLGVACADGYDVSLEQVTDLLCLDLEEGRSIQEVLQIRLSQLAGGKWL